MYILKCKGVKIGKRAYYNDYMLPTAEEVAEYIGIHKRTLYNTPNKRKRLLMFLGYAKMKELDAKAERDYKRSLKVKNEQE